MKNVFGVTSYMIKESRKLKTGGRSLPEPLLNLSSRIINNSTIEIIQQYYQNDEISRMLPGKKD